MKNKMIEAPTTGLPRQQRGSSMIEILVAVLVLSVGLLGVASLQAVGLKNNTSAYLRTQANMLAADVLDRMRANRTVAVGGGYNIAIGAAAPSGSGITATDLGEWKTNLQLLLPDGDGEVDCVSDECTVTVQWRDAQSNGAFSSESIDVVTRL